MEIDTNNSKKNTIKLPLNDTVIEISGDFDSGNLNSASINLANQVHHLSLRNCNWHLEGIKLSKAALKHGSTSTSEPRVISLI